MKVSLLYISIIYEFIIILFHLQMMSNFYFTYSTVLQEVVSVTVSTIQYSNGIYNIIIQWLI